MTTKAGRDSSQSVAETDTRGGSWLTDKAIEGKLAGEAGDGSADWGGGGGGRREQWLTWTASAVFPTPPSPRTVTRHWSMMWGVCAGASGRKEAIRVGSGGRRGKVLRTIDAAASAWVVQVCQRA